MNNRLFLLALLSLSVLLLAGCVQSSGSQSGKRSGVILTPPPDVTLLATPSPTRPPIATITTMPSATLSVTDTSQPPPLPTDETAVSPSPITSPSASPAEVPPLPA